jgi:hypothetical protein
MINTEMTSDWKLVKNHHFQTEVIDSCLLKFQIVIQSTKLTF